MAKLQKSTLLSVEAAHEQREWYVVDLKDQTLGRAATRIASVLRGKHKPTYTPNVDCGDFVIAINAGEVKLTGRKMDDKLYRHHTEYPGGLVEIPAGQLIAKHPDRAIRRAVWGMLPKGPLGRRLIKKLKVYAGSEHGHTAQKPRPLAL
jgi:large subunit ribosomal protein L13